MEDAQIGTSQNTRLGLLRRLLMIQWSTHRGYLLALFSIIAIILVAPVWTVRYPPLVDFPNHLASAFVLAHLDDPRFRFSQFYAPSWNLGPYLTMDLVLVGLLKALPPMLAGRIFLSLCLLVVPPAVWFFLREANPGQDSMAFWSLLLCSNMFFFLYGLLNLQLSFALCFVVLGMWLRYIRCPSPSRWWLLCVLVTALYFTHIGGFSVAAIGITSYSVLGRRPLREILRSWLLFLPGVATYSYWRIYSAGSWPIEFGTLDKKLGHLVAIMLGYSVSLDFFTILVILGSILVACIDNQELRWNYHWLGVLVCLLVLYFLVPAGYGPGNMAARRLLPFIFVVALAGAKIGRRARYLAPIALLLFVLRTGNIEMNFRLIQPHLEELAQSFSVIPRDARVFPVIHHTGKAGRPEDYFWAYGVIARGWFSPYLFHDKGVQPLRLRLETYTLGPRVAFVSLDPSVKWSRVQADYDYIWAYGAAGYSGQMAKVGSLVFDSNGLEVFKMSSFATKRHQKASKGRPLRQQKVTPESSQQGRLTEPPHPHDQHIDS
jgi:hypothetical protein